MADITTVSLDDAAQKLRDQIRTAFVELIPPEQWRAMVKSELESFSKPRVGQRNQWGNAVPDQPSVLHELCEKVFCEEVSKELSRLISEPVDGDTGSYDPVTQAWRPAVSKLIKSWLTENADKLVITTVQALAYESAQRVLMGIQR